jgi:hypothetical protein
VALKTAVFGKWRDGRRREINAKSDELEVIVGPGSY